MRASAAGRAEAPARGAGPKGVRATRSGRCAPRPVGSARAACACRVAVGSAHLGRPRACGTASRGRQGNGTKREQGAACPGEATRQRHGCEHGLQRAPPRRSGGCGAAARAGPGEKVPAEVSQRLAGRAAPGAQRRARTLDERPRGRHLARRGDASSSRVRGSRGAESCLRPAGSPDGLLACAPRDGERERGTA